MQMPLNSSDIEPSVACIVVNWNGYADTLECLASLAQQSYPRLHTILIDNGSTNDSVPRIRTAFPEVEVIETGRNLGFPSGTNVGMRAACGAGFDYLWLLNNDTVCPPDTCEKLVRKALAQPQAGILGSVLYYMHEPSQVQAWGGGNVSTLLGHTSHTYAAFLPGPRTYMTFASALIPRPVVERVGLLHEGYFMYWDDSDYALRVVAAGYGLSVAEDTAILHKEGGSSTPRNPTTDRFSTASGLQFLKRFSPVPPLSQAFFLASRVLTRVLRRKTANLRAVLQGARDYWRQRGRHYNDSL
jgi:GT2 family glycosyltransferase